MAAPTAEKAYGLAKHVLQWILKEQRETVH